MATELYCAQRRSRLFTVCAAVSLATARSRRHARARAHLWVLVAERVDAKLHGLLEHADGLRASVRARP
jgi:hypothetical protein